MPVFASEELKLGPSFLRENITILIVTESLKFLTASAKSCSIFPFKRNILLSAKCRLPMASEMFGLEFHERHGNLLEIDKAHFG